MTDPTIAHLRTLSSGSPSKAEVNWLCDEVEDLRAEVERLRGEVEAVRSRRSPR